MRVEYARLTGSWLSVCLLGGSSEEPDVVCDDHRFLPEALFIRRENRTRGLERRDDWIQFWSCWVYFPSTKQNTYNENSRRTKRNPWEREVYSMFCWVLYIYSSYSFQCMNELKQQSHQSITTREFFNSEARINIQKYLWEFQIQAGWKDLHFQYSLK